MKRQQITILGVLGLLATAGLAVASVGQGAAQNPARTSRTFASTNVGCHVGSRAPLVERAIDALGQRVEKPATIVGCGRRAGEELIVAVYVASGSICAVIERPVIGAVQGGGCKLTAERWSKYCPRICFHAEATAPRQRGKPHRTLVSDIAPAPIAALELAEAEASVHKRFYPLVVEVAGELLQRFGQMEPFDVVTTVLAPCIPPRRLRLSITLSQEQRPIVSRGVNFPPHPCDVIVPGS